MKRLFPILSSALLSITGCLLLFSQTPSSKAALSESIKDLSLANGAPAAITTGVVNARREVLRQQDVLSKTRSAPNADPAAVAKAQADLEAKQRAMAELTKEAAPGVATSQMVPRDEGAHLIQLVTDFYSDVKQSAQSAAGWELALIISAVGLGFGGTVFSIFSWNKASAIMSALVVVTGAIPKIYPVHERAVYYRTLTNQSYSLLAGLNIPYQLTLAEYDDGGRRLKVLEEYRATKYPDTADVDSTTEDLFKDLNAAKTVTAEVR